ncbi:hypothetical protein GOODEAATRI_034040 [Goodea atripinnis]|uniref:RPEL repeat protein n=1 Tax=Goodea atripinnis TaxID=208336 RepID=A0ABV0N7F9_9TELE
MTGLINDNVRAEMRKYLQDENSDELLLQKMQTAQYNERERALKIKLNRPTLRAALNVEESETPNDSCIIQPLAKSNKLVKDNSLYSKIEESKQQSGNLLVK